MGNNEKTQQNLDWLKEQSIETQVSLLGNLIELAKFLAN